MALLYMFLGDNSTHHQEYNAVYMAFQVGRYTYVVILSIFW